MIKFTHGFHENSASLEIIGDDSNIEYTVEFYYFLTLVYTTTVKVNFWAKSNNKTNQIKVYDEQKVLVFEKTLENNSNLLSIWNMTSDNIFIKTIPNFNYSTVHERSLTHDGCIVDIGCLYWDWSSFFINKKRIIGIDPFENEINGTELFKGLIGAFDGKTIIKYNGIESSVFSDNEGGTEFPVLSWKSFCKLYNIDKISVLKINIEGAEYPLLNSLDIEDYKKIDQIVISFHEWINPNWSELTKVSLQLLQNNGFKIMKIDQQLNWYLALK